MQEATSLHQQIMGPVHGDVARCLDSVAGVLFRAGDQEIALSQAQKALAMFWQTEGFDSYEAINAHHTLSLFLQALKSPSGAPRTDEAIFHLRACIYLLELIAGPASPELPSQYFKLGNLFQEVGMLQPAYQFFLVALERSRNLADALQEAHIAHQVAYLESALGLFKEALAHEKRSYSIFKDVLGDAHNRTIESSLCMSTFTQKAVEQATDKTRLRSVANGGVATPPAPFSSATHAEAPGDTWISDLEGMGRRGPGQKKKKGGKRK